MNIDKNNLNVLTCGIYSWRYPRNWIRNPIQFLRNLKFVWQRAKNGYCDWDLWDLDYFYTNLFIKSLWEFQENLHGAPDELFDKENDSIKPWQNYIKEMVEHFYNSLEENEVQKNEFDEEFHAYPLHFEDVEGKNYGRLVDTTPKDIKDKWFARDLEIAQWRTNELDKALDMLKEHYQSLWD